jgi:hypothetical protein
MTSKLCIEPAQTHSQAQGGFALVSIVRTDTCTEAWAPRDQWTVQN